MSCSCSTADGPQGGDLHLQTAGEKVPSKTYNIKNKDDPTSDLEGWRTFSQQREIFRL